MSTLSNTRFGVYFVFGILQVFMFTVPYKTRSKYLFITTFKGMSLIFYNKAVNGQAPAVQRLDNTIHQAPVVQRVDNAIHRINHYPADSVVYFVNTYPLDSDLSGG